MRTSVSPAGVWSGQMLGLEYEFVVGPPLFFGIWTGMGGTRIVVRSVGSHKSCHLAESVHQLR
jgi:hypothetical protein